MKWRKIHIHIDLTESIRLDARTTDIREERRESWAELKKEKWVGENRIENFQHINENEAFIERQTLTHSERESRINEWMNPMKEEKTKRK